mgnify:CR=1 FL=1|tara:strand:+ start:106 stop:861 length:756 start_codon:yes stop_codon:yes gene_type:complete
MSEIRKIAGNAPLNKESVLDELFKNMPEDESWEVALPSKGKFYTNFVGATVTPLTFQDEEKILSSGGKGGSIINMLVDTCVQGVTVSELLPMDKLYLLMKIREVSYGSMYEFPITCPQCSTEINTELDLANHFAVTEVPDDLTDPREITLPKLGVALKVRFPRAQDEAYLEDSKTVLKNLYRFIVSIGEIVDPVLISKAVKRMHIQDVKTIIAGVNRDEYGIDPRFQFNCPSCKTVTLMAIPLGVDFFSVS